MEKNQKTERKLKGLYRFFTWCSGARIYLLEKCPVDYNKFFGIGITIFLTGSLAAISGGYALYYVFDDPRVAIPFGIFWGVLIFFIDWYLVSSLRKENEPFKEILASIPRFILAILLAIVIAEPIKLKIFEKEIDQELATLKSDKTMNLQSQLSAEYSEIDQLQKQNERLMQEIRDKENQRREMFERVVKEAEGRSITGVVGKGPVYKEKKQEFELLDKQYVDLKNRNLQKIEKNEARIEQLVQYRQQEMQEGEELVEDYSGLLARLEALGNLKRRNIDLQLTTTFILILFIAIESMPVFVKLISKRGPYDALYELEEGKQSLAFKKELIEYREKLKSELDVADGKKKVADEAQQKNNEEVIRTIMNAKKDLQLEYVKEWMGREKENMLAELKKNGNDELKDKKTNEEENSDKDQTEDKNQEPRQGNSPPEHSGKNNQNA